MPKSTKSKTTNTPEAKEASLMSICAEYAQASADIDTADQLLRSCKCSLVPTEKQELRRGQYPENCLSKHYTLAKGSPAQEANFPKMCQSCQTADKAIHERIDARIRYSKTQAKLLQSANRLGKALIKAA